MIAPARPRVQFGEFETSAALAALLDGFPIFSDEIVERADVRARVIVARSVDSPRRARVIVQFDGGVPALFGEWAIAPGDLIPLEARRAAESILRPGDVFIFGQGD